MITLCTFYRSMMISLLPRFHVISSVQSAEDFFGKYAQSFVNLRNLIFISLCRQSLFYVHEIRIIKNTARLFQTPVCCGVFQMMSICVHSHGLMTNNRIRNNRARPLSLTFARCMMKSTISQYSRKHELIVLLVRYISNLEYFRN